MQAVSMNPNGNTSNGVSSTTIALDANTLAVRLLPNGVAVIVYDVPGESVNTLRTETGRDLEAALLAVESDPAILAVVVVSGKPDSFVVGADITMLKELTTAADGERMSRDAQQSFEKIAKFTKPIVAAVHGACLGGGFELALACHGRVASDHPKTTFGLPEVQLGLLPGADGLQRVAALAGITTALDLGLTGRNLRPSKAKQLGLVNEICPPSILTEVAAEYALKLAKKSASKPKKSFLDLKSIQTLALEKNPIGRSLVFKKARAEAFKKSQGHYPAIDSIIEVLEVYAKSGFQASQETEAKAFGKLVISQTAARLIEIFFATNDLKKETGVDDPDVKARPVQKIGMLGAGLMGAGISYITMQAGISVRLKDKDQSGLARGIKYVDDIYAQKVKRRSQTLMEKSKQMSLLTGTVDYSGIGNVDVVIEAVFEDLDLKHTVLRDVEKIIPTSTIFASNTSSIPITEIAAASSRPENVIGMHYFSPVHKMPLLEIIKTKQTAPAVVATAVALGKRQGKIVIVVNDGVGFYTSRVLGPLMNEASYLLAEGVPIEEIDHAMIRWGWPVGPITLLDEVGIDVAAHVGPIMQQAFGDRLSPPPIMSQLVGDNRKGRKNERGFYLYGKAAEKAKKAKFSLHRSAKGKPVDASVYPLLGITPQPGKMAAEEIQMRCSLQFINEAMHCYGEGILRSARDGDVGAVFGLGFPPFRGGPFRYADALGVQEILKRISSYEDRFGQRWSPAPVLLEMARTGKRFYP
jgi:3-hydroxyacyl-CoA dehydrogenase / enoyl-CoA hydratase / 3-hydroxybutyryl-CoA epimerase